MSVAKFTITASSNAAEVEAAISNSEMTAQERAAIAAALSRTRAFDWAGWLGGGGDPDHNGGLLLTGAEVRTIPGKDKDGKEKTFAAICFTTTAGKDAVIYLSSLFKTKVDKDGVAHTPWGELRDWCVGSTDLEKAQNALKSAEGKILYAVEDRFIRTGKFGDYQDCVRSWTTTKPAE